VYYKLSSSVENFSVSENIDVDHNSYDITKLTPYTTYSVYVTVINNAEDKPESEPSNVVEARTLAAPPDKPPPPRLCNGHLIAPDISNSKGPIKFVDILIYGGSMTDGAPNEREIPYDSEAYTDNKDWYMIRYSWEKYKSSIAHNPISIEDILTTIGGETLTQTSVKGLSTYAHYVYIRVVALDSSGRNVTLVSEAAHYTVPTVVPAMVSSDSGSRPAIIAVIVVAVVVIMATIVIIVMLKRRIQHLQTLLHNDKNAGVSMELADATCNPAYDTACLSESKAPLPGESYKSGEEGYEELSSCTREKDKHTYQDVDNLK
jgi:hypothetical protein